MSKAIFLDRDNTIIHNDGDLGDAKMVSLIPGAAEAMKCLHHEGFKLIVITNQGGVARGMFTEDDVHTVHAEVQRQLQEATGEDDLVCGWYFCPWHPEGTVETYRREHPWRKPQPGMLLQAAKDHDLQLDFCWMVGDQERDVLAGLAAGCRGVRLAPGAVDTKAEFTCDSLAEAAAYILTKEGAA